ncbi:hypothetical protein HYW83_06450 [Candidatus Peregrinibacteria bacterium]|nr:hypothetical protein [Candidatus Peregrinibacteria bacterium]
MGPFIFLDTETTGIDPSRDHIIEVAAIQWENGKIIKQWESLVNPRVPLPYEITLLTGIKNEDVKTAPLFADIKKNVLEFAGGLPIVGHNIAFDTAFLRSHHAEVKNPEIDTVALARILLLKESSYALEVLMKKYGLTLRDSHRAMVDCETTVEFFEFLLGRIAEIPQAAMGKIQAVLEKSGWTGKELFSRRGGSVSIPSEAHGGLAGKVPDVRRGGKAECEAHTRKRSGRMRLMAARGAGRENAVPSEGWIRTAAPNQLWNDEIITQFLSGQKILLESAAEIPFQKLKEQPILVAYNTTRKRDEILRAAASLNLSTATLKEPNFYISPKKLASKLKQHNFPAEETPFLLKMILWNETTETGDRDELSLDREEFPLFDLLADEEGQDIFWKKALKTASHCFIVLIHQYALARGIAEKLTDGIQHQQQRRSLIIAEASRLEDSFTNAFFKRFTEINLRPIFGEKAAMLFGLMGIFYERFVSEDEAGFKGNVILDDELRQTHEWKRVLIALANLPDHPTKEKLAEVFKPQPNTANWIRASANELVFHQAPILIAEYFQKCTQSFQKIILQSEALSGDGSFRLIRELFEFGSEWKEIKMEREIQNTGYGNLNIKIPDDFPEPYSEGYFKRCIKLFTEIICEKRGRVLFLLSSKKTVAAMYQALLPKIQPIGIRLLAMGPSGGKGKSLALFKENPEKSALLSTNQILPNLQEIENDIDIAVFQKIPFDPPNDPILANRSKQFENGFEQYTLPRAITRFREILAELGKSAQNKSKTCYLLDSRLKNRDYGKLFILG